MNRRERLEAFVAEHKSTILDQSARAIQRILDETANEDWQEFEADPDEQAFDPEVTLVWCELGDGYPMMLSEVHTNHDSIHDTFACERIYTHYRVITGPREAKRGD